MIKKSLQRPGLNKLPEGRSGGGGRTGGTLGHLKGCIHCIGTVFRLHVAAVPGSEESRKQAGVNPTASTLINTPALRTEVWEAGYGKEPAQPANTWACVPCGQLGEQEAVKSQVPRLGKLVLLPPS